MGAIVTLIKMASMGVRVAAAKEEACLARVELVPLAREIAAVMEADPLLLLVEAAAVERVRQDQMDRLVSGVMVVVEL